jgi:membrane-bound metal-dependent hydrolase YbcI (DUF457 family)
VKLSTHVLFGVGVAAFSMRFIAPVMLVYWHIVLFVAALMQVLIDVLSHEKRVVNGRVIYRRTKFLHSPTGATVLGLLLGLYLVVVFPYGDIGVFVALLLSAYSHLLLDAITEHGIYILGRRTSSRRLLRYNNPLANALFQLIGIGLLLYSLFP